MVKVVITLLGLLGAALLSMWLAKVIGSVPIAWCIGYLTHGFFRLSDKAAVKWINRKQ